ncbi:hypothetical protein [Uliginosibacterium sp. H1]|uniref:hypothetical protein n=1 Tax=Uliginosibacterium sp. H1 TaxID=3114757 RepID=UPI002E1737BB|nr:hypothetical protein [Uliginosibacterium sp. H1]
MRRALIVLAAVLLSGCVNEGASYMVADDPHHSISLLREQRWVWDDKIEQHVVVARYPECQSRYDIAGGVKGNVQIELFEARPMLYVLHQGRDWYALGTEECKLQRFDAPPDAANLRALGSFRYQGEQLGFVAAKAQ